MNAEEVIGASARNLAAWHTANIRALGRRWSRSARLWQADEPAAPVYHAAITLESGGDTREIAALAAKRRGHSLTVCDSFDELDLEPLEFRRDTRGSWLIREPDAAPESRAASELEVEVVEQEASLRDFERTVIEGFEAPQLHRYGPFKVHAPGILNDERMRILLGRVGGLPVTAAMAYVSDGVVGVYGVATRPRYRRRGYGEEITWRAMFTDPKLPAVLQPSPAAADLYRRMGFREAGSFRIWARP